MLETEVLETASIRSRRLRGRDAFGLFPRKAAPIGDSREGGDRRSLREGDEIRIVVIRDFTVKKKKKIFSSLFAIGERESEVKCVIYHVIITCVDIFVNGAIFQGRILGF